MSIFLKVSYINEHYDMVYLPSERNSSNKKIMSTQQRLQKLRIADAYFTLHLAQVIRLIAITTASIVYNHAFFLNNR